MRTRVINTDSMIMSTNSARQQPEKTPANVEPALHALMLNNLPTAYDLAAAVCDSTTSQESDRLACAYIAGLALSRMGQSGSAEQYLRLTVEVESPQRDCLCEYGRVLVDLGKFSDALTYFERAVETDPTSAYAWRHLAATRWIVGQHAGAIYAAQTGLESLKSITTSSQSITIERELLKIIGTSWQSLGDAHRAAAAFGAMMEKGGDNLEAATTWLGFLNYIDCENEHITTARARVAQLANQSAPIGKATLAEPWKNGVRPLRIGILSPDLRSHSVSRFLLPLVSHLYSRKGTEFCFVSTSSRHDHVSEQLRQFAKTWHDAYAWEDGSLAATIAEERCDVLLDLAGWTGGSRISVMAARLARLQLTFLGWPDTTAIPGIDACITDATIGSTYVDTTTLQMNGCLVAWDAVARDISYEDVLENGALHPAEIAATTPTHPGTPLRFGSFNNPAKFSPRCLQLWGRLLRETPDSTLLIKYHGLEQEINVRLARAAMQRHGIDINKVIFMGSQPSYEEHYLTYAQIDIALDPFPYNGTTTTCEALATGAPVLTLRGSTPAGRVGASLLSAAQQTDWIAENEEQYAAKVKESALKLSELRNSRVNRRKRTLASPLCDTAAWADRWYDTVSAAVERAGMTRLETHDNKFVTVRL